MEDLAYKCRSFSLHFGRGRFEKTCSLCWPLYRCQWQFPMNYTRAGGTASADTQHCAPYDVAPACKPYKWTNNNKYPSSALYSIISNNKKNLCAPSDGLVQPERARARSLWRNEPFRCCSRRDLLFAIILALRTRTLPYHRSKMMFILKIKTRTMRNERERERERENLSHATSATCKYSRRMHNSRA